MRRASASLAVALIAIAAAAPCAARSRDGAPFAHTFSIVARDPDTGQLGVAVQSHWFSVGSVVPWAEAGVGAVATQSLTDPAYGPLGLELMRMGRTAPEALQTLVMADSGAAVRQVAMIDPSGGVAAHTGESCIAEAGHHVGENYSVQANLMLESSVWGAMAAAFETAEGDLAERLLLALEAAQAEGGDIRGQQSAALLVVSGEPTGKRWKDRIFDLRVEDHASPLVELRRLVRLQRAYHFMDEGDRYLGENDVDGALREYARAEALTPENIEMVFWHAVSLANAGRVEESLPLFRHVFDRGEIWAELVPRIRRSGFLPDDDELIGRILAQTDNALGSGDSD